jgi:hypothetical protein
LVKSVADSITCQPVLHFGPATARDIKKRAGEDAAAGYLHDTVTLSNKSREVAHDARIPWC